MNKGKRKQIAEEYQEFVETAIELTAKKFPLALSQTKEGMAEREDAYTRHIISMLEMYQIRYGDPEERLRIVTFLESQLFRTPPVADEVSHLTFDMWQDLKNAIISGKYKVPNEDKGQEK